MLLFLLFGHVRHDVLPGPFCFCDSNRVSEDEDAHDSEEEEYMASLAKLKAKVRKFVLPSTTPCVHLPSCDTFHGRCFFVCVLKKRILFLLLLCLGVEGRAGAPGNRGQYGGIHQRRCRRWWR